MFVYISFKADYHTKRTNPPWGTSHSFVTSGACEVPFACKASAANIPYRSQPKAHTP
jgi:hypothetical protein